MVTVECKTQDEADAAAARGDVIVWREGLLVARDSARAYLYGSASAVLRGSARAYLYDSARAYLYGSARAYLYGSARAYLYDSARVNAYDWARVYEGKTGRPLRQSRPVILIGPIGSRSAMLSVYQCEDGGQLIRAGCFIGSRDEFAAAVAAKHQTGQFADEYRAALAMIDALKGAA